MIEAAFPRRTTSILALRLAVESGGFCYVRGIVTKLKWDENAVPSVKGKSERTDHIGNVIWSPELGRELNVLARNRTSTVEFPLPRF